MEIKDYLHFYIGQKITPSTGKYEGIVGVLSGINLANESAVFSFEIDGLPYTTAYSYSEIKLILRKLSDMTEEEAMMVCRMQIKGLRECDRINITVMKPIVKFRIYTDGEDPDHGIERFMRIEEYLPTQFTYLLKQGFDLFGLIPAGLAIDKTSLKN